MKYVNTIRYMLTLATKADFVVKLFTVHFVRTKLKELKTINGNHLLPSNETTTTYTMQS